jgi:Ni/Fe-hydrogenase subunit HybB-like protein
MHFEKIPFGRVNNSILDGLREPGRRYFMFMSFLALVIGLGLTMWIYQVKKGMVVSGLNHPVGWGTYITNFVFWVGIAHSGTLISAILFLVRSEWRNAVSRATEAMTVIAVLTAALFPLVHLGRVWVFYYMLPYPNQRDLYPNYMSPLVWDVFAVTTYLIVSVIFFTYGLIPDAAAARDRFIREHGKDYWRAKLFKAISFGWSGSIFQWRHYNRSYMLFALLATPLVISVHSIVSWDFAASLLPGWHSTLFAPYFVAGAIHSGLAMGLTLLIPLRGWLRLKELITDRHLETIAKVLLLTTSIIAYTYVIEPAIENFTHNTFNQQFIQWRASGHLAWIYLLTIIFNVFVPLTFFFKNARRNIKWLFVASILINIGMYFERYFIITGSTSHDFMPHNWGVYTPTFPELSIAAGLASFFLFVFMSFTKLLPFVTISEFKESVMDKGLPEPEGCGYREIIVPPAGTTSGIKRKLYMYSSPANLINAIKNLCDNGLRDIEVFSPVRLTEVEKLMGLNKSPVGYWTLAGAITGLLLAIWLEFGSVQIYNIIVGGKPPLSVVPYIPIMFEFTILFATLTNFTAVMIYTKLYKRKMHPYYDPGFSSDKFGILLKYNSFDEENLRKIMNKNRPDEEYDK